MSCQGHFANKMLIYAKLHLGGIFTSMLIPIDLQKLCFIIFVLILSLRMMSSATKVLYAVVITSLVTSYTINYFVAF